MDINLSKNLNSAMSKAPAASRNSLVEVVLLVVVCALFTWFIILPKKAAVSAENTVLSKTLSQESTMSGDLTKLQAMIQSLNTNTTDIADLDQALPLDGNTINLQILINSFAQSAGVTVGDVQISGLPNAVAAGDKAVLSNPYAPGRTLQTLSGTVSVIGSFSQLQAFLQKLETSARIIDVTGLDMGATPGGNLNLEVNVNAYYLAPSN